jgi:hypothetical protein
MIQEEADLVNGIGAGNTTPSGVVGREKVLDNMMMMMMMIDYSLVLDGTRVLNVV